MPVNDEFAFYEWIRSIAPGVKTVYIPKTSMLENFSIGELTEEDIEFWGEDHQKVYPSNVFWKAFSMLENLERFEVEKGTRNLNPKTASCTPATVTIWFTIPPPSRIRPMPLTAGA